MIAGSSVACSGFTVIEAPNHLIFIFYLHWRGKKTQSSLNQLHNFHRYLRSCSTPYRYLVPDCLIFDS